MPRPLFGVIPALGAMKLRVTPEIPDGYIPQSAPISSGTVKITQWSRGEVEIRNLAKAGKPYLIVFIKGTMAEAAMLGMMAIKKLRGGK